MKIQERYLWIGAVILIAFVANNQSSNNDNLRALITTYELEGNIQDAQLADFSQQMDVVTQAEYSKGFENGRTQAGVALAQGGSLYNYTDGYHAAVSQFADQSALEVSKAILTELDTLRKMVPRLMNQINELNKSDGYALDMLLDTLSEDMDMEEDYLEIIDTLLSNEEELAID
jgi:hypothetical protein